MCKLLLLIAVATVFIVDAANTGRHAQTNTEAIWQNWKNRHGKQYTDVDEQMHRRDIWQQRVDEMTQHNLRYEVGLESYKKGLNQFSDLTWDELKAMHLMSLDMGKFEMNDNYKTMAPVDMNNLPASIDWRTHGYVTPVKNQGQCGSCWAFSTAATLEGQMANKTGRQPVSLSPQQLVDCDHSGSYGCNGGWPAAALQYTAQYGIESFDAYPYTAQDDQCNFNQNQVEFRNSDSLFINNAGEQRLAEMVALRGPISVCVQVTSDFYSYSSGIYTTNQCTQGQINHAVLAAGYGQGFWLVKNSWGESWGEQGYIRMARNRDDMCNIALYPVAAII